MSSTVKRPPRGPIARGRIVAESVSGALQIAFHMVTTRLLRTWRTTWGARPAEIVLTLPGDNLIPDASWGYTHAVTVDAPPDRVWPWLAQLGQGRGGFYSYEGLENLIGCQITNATEIMPQFQDLAVGDGIRLHPKAPALEVALLEPNSHLVLHGELPDTGDANIWAFHLIREPDGCTRLIERGRGRYGRSFGSRLAFGPTLLEPIGFVMSRKMLRTLAERAAQP